jgi:branched-chain amino acid transport system ATP-binding protein
MTAILEISHVTRRFEGLLAVDDISFMLQRGEILGLIGPNGAGKTTLVSLISGTLAPNSGDILFEGRSLIRLPAYRRARLGIARTFQIMRLFPGLSVLDNVAVGALFGRGGGQAQLAKAREQARVQLDFVGLGKNVDARTNWEVPAASGWSWQRHWRCSRKFSYAMKSWQVSIRSKSKK